MEVGPMGCHALSTQSLTNMESQTDLFLSKVCMLEPSTLSSTSGALYGLPGAMLSVLIRNRKIYTDKFAALASLFFFSMINFVLGLLPYTCWCQYVDCVPFKWWSCKDKATFCETMVSDAQLTLTCMSNGNFRVFPFTNISQARANNLCNLICR